MGGITVSDIRRDATLDCLAELAVDGGLVWSYLMTVKQETFDREGVEMTVVGKTDVKLIYVYLGGPEREKIKYSDVDKSLHSTMPDYKATGYLNLSLVGEVQ